jgi:anti-sigma regulatory factor (Ser/Thr protein kinase)
MIIPVSEGSQVAEARRQASEAARLAGFGEEDCGRAALVATELATNLVKHGGGGEIVVGHFDDADGAGVEILALDRGRGMADVQQCLRDGFSTAGSPGTGLGAVSRLADRFGLFSRPEQGTVVLARLTAKRQPPPTTSPPAAPTGPQVGAIAAICPGEDVCGDAWGIDARHGETLLVADGSGHGPIAATAARVAVETFRAQADKPLPRLLEAIHRALQPTRGAAVAVARIDRGARVVRFAGVGNISGTLVTGGQSRHMVSHNGTAGHVAPRIAEFTYPFAGAPTLILASDGLTTRWDVASYPGLAQAHPSIVAGVLYRDHRRGRDDATVVVLKAPA